MQHLPCRAPAVGDRVGDYLLVAELGRGGHGHVFKAERAGQLHAIKFYPAGMRAYWQREADILRCLEGVENVVRLVDRGEWPHPETGWLHLVLELVEGWTLETYARERNPSAREAGRLMLRLGRTLVEVERRGVLHRDLKRENILVRAANGEPVLVDFGVGALEGVSTLPRDGLPPGTAEYVSPEAWRYLGGLAGARARYEPGVGDELWALGVTLYWLLTGRRPFGTRLHLGAMLKAVVGQTPPVPHEHNARIPRRLSEVCMRLLEKEPAARYADMEALCAALEAALASMEGEACWDEPLHDPDAPENRTTDSLAELALDTWQRVQQELNAGRPRRGREREAAPLAEAPAQAAPEPPPDKKRGRWRSTWAGLSVVLAALVGALVFPAVQELASEPPGKVAGRATSPLARWLPDDSAPPACLVQEVAGTWPPSEAGEGAARFLASTPAPAPAMRRQQDSRVQRPEQSPPPPRTKARSCVPRLEQVCTAGLCTLWLAGCTGAPVRPPPPPPADCPPGAEDVMNALDMESVCPAYLTDPERDWDAEVTVPLGRISFTTGFRGSAGTCGNLPPRTRLSGELFLGTVEGKTWAIARLTQARTPEGKTYPVCMYIGKAGKDPGVEVLRPGDKPGTVVIYEWVHTRRTKRFR